MRKTLVSMVLAVALTLGVGGCVKDNSTIYNGNITEQAHVRELNDKGYNKIFSNKNSLQKYLLAGGTFEYAEKLMPYFNEKEILSLKEKDVQPDYAVKLANLDLDYKGIEKLYETGMDANYATKILSYQNSKGDKIFGLEDVFKIDNLNIDGEDIFQFKNTDKPNALITIANYDAPFLIDTSKQFLYNLSLNYDTVLVPVSSQEEIFSAINSIPDIKLFTSLAHGSRVSQKLDRVPFRNSVGVSQKNLSLSETSIVSELTDVFEEYVGNSSNGTWYNQRTGEIKETFPYPEFNQKLEKLGLNLTPLEYDLLINNFLKESDNSNLDIFDTIELKKYLSRLNPDTTIFLFSCSNGEGKEKKVNLANVVSECSGGKNVISASEKISTHFDFMNVEQIYPLKIKLINQSGKDITYNPKFLSD